ncbi:uncharacterized protein PHACADRAFT_214290 [Phanerochaete carnosa HHB-10118-sp]|uniref:Uncharacterized protein n=1 Tax=Phanerochaete carnosa (strain HHB-10118-sp) TaxID=650164 RepID=K5UJN1_PHACS|nr:uncharacterized protein PHACADRAFT_214290 [Phanerochaete carnosa HHB-10118-sp]EKM49771.1 hypothetical protein PHACADRAFT_214290 [Phanerochaete carnosa HHB-10118-sp]
MVSSVLNECIIADRGRLQLPTLAAPLTAGTPPTITAPLIITMPQTAEEPGCLVAIKKWLRCCCRAD